MSGIIPEKLRAPIALMPAATGQAQPDGSNRKYYALLIGNQGYEPAAALRTPEKDIQLVGDALANAGFYVEKRQNIADSQTFLATLSDAMNTAKEWKMAGFLLYYAGHGCADEDGEDCLLPTGIRFWETEWTAGAVKIEVLLRKLGKQLPKMDRLIIIDACRKELQSAKPKGVRWIGSVPSLAHKAFDVRRGTSAAKNAILCFSTEKGKYAKDYVGSETVSPFAGVLAEAIQRAPTGTDFVDVLEREVVDGVSSITRKDQQPRVAAIQDGTSKSSFVLSKMTGSYRPPPPPPAKRKLSIRNALLAGTAILVLAGVYIAYSHTDVFGRWAATPDQSNGQNVDDPKHKDKKDNSGERFNAGGTTAEASANEKGRAWDKELLEQIDKAEHDNPAGAKRAIEIGLEKHVIDFNKAYKWLSLVEASPQFEKDVQNLRANLDNAKLAFECDNLAGFKGTKLSYGAGGKSFDQIEKGAIDTCAKAIADNQGIASLFASYARAIEKHGSRAQALKQYKNYKDKGGNEDIVMFRYAQLEVTPEVKTPDSRVQANALPVSVNQISEVLQGNGGGVANVSREAPSKSTSIGEMDQSDLSSRELVTVRQVLEQIPTLATESASKSLRPDRTDQDIPQESPSLAWDGTSLGMLKVGQTALLRRQYALARVALKEALRMGQADAALSLGVIYLEGLGIDKDESRAMDYFTQAGGSENGKALVMLAEAALTKNLFAEAAKYAALAQEAGAKDAPALRTKIAAQQNAFDCDRLAARPLTTGLPAGIEGVDFEKIEFDAAKASCEKAIADFPGIARYKTWAGRVFHKNGQHNLALTQYLAAEKQGDVVAINSLGTLFDDKAFALRNPAKAEDYFHRAAKLGDAYGQYYFADKLERRGSYKDAEGWYLKAVNAGHEYAMADLGWMYWSKKIEGKADSDAFALFQKAAELGNSSGMNGLGRAYELGRGANSSIENAVTWQRKAAALDNSLAMVTLGNFYYNKQIALKLGEDGQRIAFDWYQKAAGLENKVGLYYVAWMQENGIGVPQNESEALKNYLASADKDYPNAAAALGWMYQNGRGTKVDYVEACKWHDIGEKGGVSRSMVGLAECFENGRGGINKDMARAFSLYERAAVAGHGHAMYRLGYNAEFGDLNGKKDIRAAKTWYEKSAELKWTSPMYRLGELYFYGSAATPQNDQLALSWYQKVVDTNNESDQDFVDALLSLGWMYAAGRGTAEDWKKAEVYYARASKLGSAEASKRIAKYYSSQDKPDDSQRWFREAEKAYLKRAETGEAIAMVEIGLLYSNGSFGEKSAPSGTPWFKKAADKGNADGMYRYGIALQEGVGVEKNEMAGLQLIKDAAAKGLVDASQFLAQDYEERKDFEAAYKYREDAAKNGSLYDKIEMARLITDNAIEGRTKTDAERLLLEVVKDADTQYKAQAMDKLGDLLTDDDLAKASDWYVKSFEAEPDGEVAEKAALRLFNQQRTKEAADWFVRSFSQSFNEETAKWLADPGEFAPEIRIEIQKILIAKGELEGEPDGTFGTKTFEGLKKLSGEADAPN